MVWRGVAGMVAVHSAVMAFIIITAVYFFAYFFASTTALISTMFGVFLAVLLGNGIDGFQAAMTLAAFNCLSSCITIMEQDRHRFILEETSISEDLVKIGFVLGLFYIAVWWGVGSLWWQLLNWVSPFL